MLSIVAAACGSISSESEPDANPAPAVDAAPDALTETERTLTQSSSQDLVDGDTVGCVNNGFHRETRFFRAFDLAEFEIFHDFAVRSVEVGLERATAGPSGQQTAEVRLYKINGPLLVENFERIGAAGTLVPDSPDPVMHKTAVSGTAPAGSQLVVEFFLPDGLEDQNRINVGVNPEPQTGPTFIIAPNCNIAQLTDTANLPFGARHLVMNVIGDLQP